MINTNFMILAGGGIDSSLCVHLLKKEECAVRLLHINFGQKAAEQEWHAVQRIGKYYNSDVKQIEVRGISDLKTCDVSGRNAAFVFLGLMDLEEYECGLCLGLHAGTMFYDSTEIFFERIRLVVKEYTDSRVNLLAPLLNFTKEEVINFAKSINFPLELTYSCQQGDIIRCGKCHSCKDREALGC